MAGFLSSVLPAAAQVPGCLVAFPEVFLSDPSQLSSRVCLSLFFAPELLFLLSLNSFISETIKNPAGVGVGEDVLGLPKVSGNTLFLPFHIGSEEEPHLIPKVGSSLKVAMWAAGCVYQICSS